MVRLRVPRRLTRVVSFRLHGLEGFGARSGVFRVRASRVLGSRIV